MFHIPLADYTVLTRRGRVRFTVDKMDSTVLFVVHILIVASE